MANIVKELQINSFVKGLITEANPLTFPENASLDEENFVLELNGSRSRRLGLDYESGYAFTNTTFTDANMASANISFHYWPNPGGSTTVSLGVVRIKNKYYFINLLATSPSNAILDTYFALGDTGPITSAVINGFLIISPSTVASASIIFSWNKTTNLIASTEQIYIKIRDFYGIYESTNVTDRPAALTMDHHYNLLNQGWNDDRMQSTCGVAVSPMQCVKNTVNPVTPGGVAIPTGYPSNADVMSLGRIGATGAAGMYNKFDPLALFANSTDNNQSPKGHFVLSYNARGSDRTTYSGVVGLPTDLENSFITIVAAYASRAFYSGCLSNISGGDNNSPNYSGYIFFSQIATSKDKLSKCYQENDPTSPDISDILDTDGGTIHIPEATKIVGLVPYGTSLIVFAENGVWEITGENGVFRATSYQVNKITNIGVVSPTSIVEGAGQLLYWANSGIYAVIPDQTTGRLSVQSITLNTIQTTYNNLSTTCKQYAKGFFDERNNIVRWLYNDTSAYSTTNYISKYNKQLNLNLSLKAFNIYNLGDTSATTSPYVADFIKIPNYSPSSIVSRVEPYSLLTIKNGTFTISKYSSTRFKDWYTNDSIGVDYSSYLITGHEIFGDISHSKQIPYINFYFDRTEQNFILSGTDLVLDFPSSCLVQAQWDWCNSANSGKWGAQFQAYRLLRNYIPTGVGTFDYGERVIITKSKLRGSGKALSLKILSETGKDMKLLGWSSDVTVKPKV